MIPVLYQKQKRTFINDYIGFLVDAISCVVTEGRNDEYELEMTYPVDGLFCGALELDAIIKAKPNRQDDPQPFRIYRIDKKINGVLTVSARHIVHDLSKVTVEPFETTGTITDAINGLMNHSIPACGFIFETDKTTQANYKVSYPMSFRSLMGGTRGSLLDVFGTAEYHYDGYDISLLSERGTDNGVTIRYGISMTDLKQEEACDSVYTAVYPFWQYGNDYVSLDENIVSVEGSYPFSRIMTLDLSSEFSNRPTQEQLRAKTQQYITDNEVGIPKVSLDVKFSGTEAEQDINLCDIVHVEFEKLGVTASAKCISLTYDVLTERVTEVSLGYYKNTFIDTVTDQVKGITVYDTLNEDNIEKVIKGITTNENGYLLFHSSTNTTHVDELLIVTGTDSVNVAKEIWRWNKNGLGFSSNGYNGSYELAINVAGQIVANMVKTGTLRAIEIIAGNDKFHVTPNGTLTANAGYIGTASQGFKISASDIKNSMIRLYIRGIAFTDSSGNEVGIVGRTESHVYDGKITDIILQPSYVGDYAGIGMILSKSGSKMGLYYRNTDNDYVSAILRYPITISGTSGAVLSEKAIRVTKNIDMHGHKFYARCYKTSEFVIPHDRVRYMDGRIQYGFIGLNRYTEGVKFNQVNLLDSIYNYFPNPREQIIGGIVKPNGNLTN